MDERSFLRIAHALCEDVGMRPFPLADEIADTSACVRIAEDWLRGWESDPDLAVDTRVAVPIYADQDVETRHWATLGVRGAAVAGGYARPPRWRPQGSTSDLQCRPKPSRRGM